MTSVPRAFHDVPAPPATPAGRVAVPAPAVRAPGWDLLLVCLAVYVAAAVGRVHQLFRALLPFHLALVSAALALLLYFLSQTGMRRVERIASGTTLAVAGLLAWAALSVPFALAPGVAFHVLADSFVKTVVMFAVIAGAVRSTRDVERLATTFFAVTVVYAGVVLARDHLGGADWRLGDLYDYDANDFATLVACAMPLGLYLVLAARRRPALRLFGLAGLGVLGVGLIRSGSRGGFLALLAVIAWVLLRFTTLPVRARVAGLAVVLAVVVAAASGRYWNQMQTILNPSQDYNSTSEGGRLQIWKRGLAYLASAPVFGVGAGNFQTAEGTISPLARAAEYGGPVRWSAPHNSFVQVGAELGVPGLVLFVAMLGCAFRALARTARRAARDGPEGARVARLAQSLAAALVAFVVGGFFLSLAYADMLYTLLALAVALEKVARSTAVRGPSAA